MYIYSLPLGWYPVDEAPAAVLFALRVKSCFLAFKILLELGVAVKIFNILLSCAVKEHLVHGVVVKAVARPISASADFSVSFVYVEGIIVDFRLGTKGYCEVVAPLESERSYLCRA